MYINIFTLILNFIHYTGKKNFYLYYYTYSFNNKKIRMLKYLDNRDSTVSSSRAALNLWILINPISMN